MPDSAPLIRTVQATIPATAATTAYDQSIGEAPFTGVVSGASFTPEANITGHADNYRTYTIVNKGSDGNGTTVVGTLAFVASITATDFDEKAFTLSATAADLVVTEGDVLAVVETYAASGLACPGGLIQVQVTRS